jgi:hypothetical protein
LSPVFNTGVIAPVGGLVVHAYAEFSLSVAIGGPSGGGVYDIKGGQVRLVGVFVQGIMSGPKVFLPLDRIYADTATAVGSSHPSGTIADLMRNICTQRWKDGMPQI